LNRLKELLRFPVNAVWNNFGTESIDLDSIVLVVRRVMRMIRSVISILSSSQPPRSFRPAAFRCASNVVAGKRGGPTRDATSSSSSSSKATRAAPPSSGETKPSQAADSRERKNLPPSSSSQEDSHDRRNDLLLAKHATVYNLVISADKALKQERRIKEEAADLEARLYCTQRPRIPPIYDGPNWMRFWIRKKRK